MSGILIRAGILQLQPSWIQRQDRGTVRAAGQPEGPDDGEHEPEHGPRRENRGHLPAQRLARAHLVVLQDHGPPRESAAAQPPLHDDLRGDQSDGPASADYHVQHLRDHFLEVFW